MPVVHLTDYDPHPGQIAFHADGAKLRLLRGAVRSGKTHAMIWELIHMAMRTAKNAGPGATFLVCRKTGPALTDTTQKDFFDQLPRELIMPGSVRTQEGRTELTLLGGTRVIFRSLDDWKKKGGASYDAVFPDEAWEFDELDFDMLLGRLSGKWGPRRMVLTTNPPTRNHWLYRRFVTNRKDNMSEHQFSTYMNRANLPPGYIEDLEESWDDARKKRFLNGDWGFTSDRTPVYPEFEENRHAAILKWRPGFGQLLSGWDFGFRHPCVVWLQILNTGHIEYLREMVGENVDIKTFGQRFIQETETHFPNGLRHMIHYVDIAGRQKNDTGTSSVLELVKLRIVPRYRKLPLMRSINQLRDLIAKQHLGLPYVRVDRLKCPILVEALQGGYGMRELKPGKGDEDEPFKDGWYDHVCLVGSTRIRTLSGWREIKDLVGSEFDTYAYDGRRLVPAHVSVAWQTSPDAEVWRLLHDGGEFRATPNHPMMLRDGTYRRLDELQPGDRLMPFYEAIGRRGHVMMNLNDGSTAYEHRYIYGWFHGPLLPEHHVHHRNANPGDNDPSNLEQLHRDVHMGAVYAAARIARPITNRSTNPWTPESRAKVGLWAKAYMRTHREPAFCDVCGTAFMRLIRKKRSPTAVVCCSNKCRDRAHGERRRAAAIALRQNHMVICVEPAGREAVYNLQVDGHHNFVAGGLVVHNCDAARYGAAPAIISSMVIQAGDGKRETSIRRPRVAV